MGLFGDLFDMDIFDLDGNGKVDEFEEIAAFDLMFGDTSSGKSKLSESAAYSGVFSDDDFDDGLDDLFDDDFDDGLDGLLDDGFDF